MNATTEFSGTILGTCERCGGTFPFALPYVPECDRREPDENGIRTESFVGNCPHCDARFRFLARFSSE